METREILQIALGIIGVAVVGLGGLIAYELTKKPATVVDQSVASAEEAEPVEKNPWEGRGDEAIAQVKEASVGELGESVRELLELGEDEESGGEETDGEGPKLTVGELVKSKKFVKEKLERDPEEAAGWRASWWGETKFGDGYYEVTYAFKNGIIEVGPTWVVDLKKGEVAAKNVGAKVVTEPAKGVESEYYGKAQEVISAMSKHTFENGLTLGGALLVYFERRAKDEADTILGWSIQHERGPIFRAYFQWKRKGENNYAEYVFDYDRKALRADSLHAANIMKVGAQFEAMEPVDILPTSYNPTAARAAYRWTGRARTLYRNPNNRPPLRALDMVLSDADLIGSLEWLLRSQAKTPDQFETCKKERNCKWIPTKKDDHFKVTYVYDLGDGQESIAWKVFPDDERIEPLDRVSKLAFRVVRAR